ncbi:FAD-dependent oxidoreductase [Rhabdobacter roseus]|uniref:Glycine/D-amino acid oxidase-like deaminating enzyme n=1 Tax=Rhabdobacter roseus TaxID=1655419 RepID=A0A840U2B1_9BACT|nr:FAD-dependent oxidoreductase [Rhabdobacter roseus]MBB5286270.1 glycine/D-amino acid oxidase-like deaminating enzyme [Rhabdobacter roseus]
MIDYLVVGQGLAGTTLAWHLLAKEKTILILNDSSRPSASGVAAGIFNPLTGKKLVKTWLADELFPYATEFYTQLEQTLGTPLLHPLNIYRPYRSLQEQNTYLAQTAEPGIQRYLAPSAPEDPALHAQIQAPYGGLEVTQSGWVDLPSLLEKSRAYFQRAGCYQEGTFDSQELAIQDEYVEWNGLRARQVVLCQGFDARESTLFDWLPFEPVKGQLLDVRLEGYPLPHIVNQGIFILPTSNGQHKVGATYSWHDLDWSTTEEGRRYLEEKLRPLLKVPYEVLGQRAGIRPATQDRRPFVGTHPRYPRVGIFNGLGTKGVTLAPYFANQLTEHFENRKDLNLLVNIGRYFSLYYR